MSGDPSAARIGAQATPGGVVVAPHGSAMRGSSALPDAVWITDRIHRGPPDTARPEEV